VDALVLDAWSIVGRELQGTVVQRLGRTSELLYLWVASAVRASISHADREELMEGFHELVYTWIFEHRAEMLTRRETQELRRHWSNRQASTPRRREPRARRIARTG
jgi:hypothetical protein